MDFEMTEEQKKAPAGQTRASADDEDGEEGADQAFPPPEEEPSHPVDNPDGAYSPECRGKPEDIFILAQG